eukprot:6167031-Pleurochrysis_carterae.AAC.2
MFAVGSTGTTTCGRDGWSTGCSTSRAKRCKSTASTRSPRRLTNLRTRGFSRECISHAMCRVLSYGTEREHTFAIPGDESRIIVSKSTLFHQRHLRELLFHWNARLIDPSGAGSAAAGGEQPAKIVASRFVFCHAGRLLNLRRRHVTCTSRQAVCETVLVVAASKYVRRCR